MKEEKLLRKWFYIQPPSHYDIPPCSCSNTHTQWSEYEKHIWCDKCQIDFIPEDNGVFDSPVSINISRLLGISFSRYNIKDNLVEILDEDNLYTKCLNISKCISEGEVIIALKNASPDIVGYAKLDLNDFSLSIINVEDDKEVLFSSEVCFDYPDTKHFTIVTRKLNGGYVLINDDGFKNFKSYILNEKLIMVLNQKNSIEMKKAKI